MVERTSRSIFFATVVFSAIHASPSRICMDSAIPESCMGEPSDFVLFAFTFLALS
jgi:hypothetical protein